MKPRKAKRRSRRPIVRLLDAVDLAIDAMRQASIARDELNRMAAERKGSTAAIGNAKRKRHDG